MVTSGFVVLLCWLFLANILHAIPVELVQSDAANGDEEFGYAIAVGTPSVTYIGAPEADGQGAVYAYTESSEGVFDQETKIVSATDMAAGMRFGAALDAQDDVLLVGCPEASAVDARAGLAIIFIESSGTWPTEMIINPGDSGAFFYFGTSVAIDGPTVVVGAYNQADPEDELSIPGAIFIYQESSSGAQDWQFSEIPFYHPESATGDRFGWSVGVFESMVVVGAPYKNSAQGMAHIIWESSPGAKDWGGVPNMSMNMTLLPIQVQIGDQFGHAVDAYGLNVVVSAPYDDFTINDRGAVYVYAESSAGARDYDQTYLTVLYALDAESGDGFGLAVSLYTSTLLVGAPLADDGATFDTGAVYLFQESSIGNMDWTEPIRTFVAPDAEANDQFGFAVASNQITMAIGAINGDSGTAGSGAAYYDIYLNNCTTHSCQNAATCIDAVDGYTCNCTLGWTGDLCDVDVDDCTSSPCQNSGVCSDTGTNAYACDCLGTGAGGLDCEIDANDCASTPCDNGGTCTDAGLNAYTCDCTNIGATGSDCENDIDECSSSPCQNNGLCIDTGLFQFACDCAGTGAEGTLCENDADDCLSSPCLWGGTCTDPGVTIGVMMCDCDGTGMKGQFCNVDEPDCGSDPCSNAGQCLEVEDVPFKFECNCTNTGYNGTLCLEDWDDCWSSPCQNGGNCTDMGFKAYECECDDFWYEGVNCELLKPQDECSSSPCINNSTCVDGEFDYACLCQDGYSGKNCSLDYDSCASSPCVNALNCTDQPPGADLNYTCLCLPGWDGPHCDIDIDDCFNVTCVNGANCTDTGAVSFQCECDLGWVGPTCAEDFDDCINADNTTCLNGGQCVDAGIGQISCDCDQTGFGGQQCDIFLEPCAGAPCLNGGICTDISEFVDVFPFYSCQCLAAFPGYNCEGDGTNGGGTEESSSTNPYEFTPSRIVVILIYDEWNNTDEFLDELPAQLADTLGGRFTDYKVTFTELYDGTFQLRIVYFDEDASASDPNIYLDRIESVADMLVMEDRQTPVFIPDPESSSSSPIYIPDKVINETTVPIIASVVVIMGLVGGIASYFYGKSQGKTMRQRKAEEDQKKAEEERAALIMHV